MRRQITQHREGHKGDMVDNLPNVCSVRYIPRPILSTCYNHFIPLMGVGKIGVY